MTTARIEIPSKLIPVFSAQGVRYRGAYGGRGSGKTRTFALMTAVWAYQCAEAGGSGVILCAREFMNSLDESSMEEVKQAIRSTPWLDDYFDLGERYIRTKNGRVRYVFAGLRHNLDSIKSKARIILCWIDEAEGVSEVAYRKLLPTVREEGSEVWVTWNREVDGSPTDQRFLKKPPESSAIVEMNYWDNEFFPDVLDQQRRDDQAIMDDATYRHVWEGAYLQHSEAQIFRGKYLIAEFEADSRKWNGPYYGLDYGFAMDPTAAIRCWVHDNVLYIDYEAGKVGLELDQTAEYLTARIPGIDRVTVRADSARPESSSYLKRHGIPRVESVRKWQGSVEDGIEHIKSYREVVIHPRCTETAREFLLYSYKQDRLSGDVLPQVVDAHNHYIDALRYAIEPLTRKSAKLRQWL